MDPCSGITIYPATNKYLLSSGKQKSNLSQVKNDRIDLRNSYCAIPNQNISKESTKSSSRKKGCDLFTFLVLDL